MAKKFKISKAEEAQAHKTLTAVLAAQKSARGKKASAAFKGDGIFGRLLAKRLYAKFLAEGGKVGGWQEFADWLIENLPKIIAMIMALFPA